MNPRGITLTIVLIGCGCAALVAGCFPAMQSQRTGTPAPAMVQNPQDQPGYWRAQYNRNRPDAPAQYAVFPEPPRNNEFAEFDNSRFQGLDAQPPLPALPADGFMPSAMIGPGVAAGAGVVPPTQFQTGAGRPSTFAAGTAAEYSSTSVPQPGIDTGDHFYPVEQLVYGGDHPDIDKPESYRLMPKDVITLTVRDHPEFSGQLEIQPDGTVRIPNAHDVVRIRGMNADEAAETLRRTIAVYIKGQCEVRVQVNRARGGYYYVFGEVMQPGRFPMGMEPVKLSEAVLAANWEANPSRKDLEGDELGPSFPAALPRGTFQAPRSADLARVALITPHRSQPSRTVHDVRSALLGVTSNDPIIRPGQIVVVPSLVPGRNQSLGEIAPSAGFLPEQSFGYNSMPARLPDIAPAPRHPPGDSSWIYTVPRQPEPEVESLILPPVESNMAAAYASSQNTSGSHFQQGYTVEGPHLIQIPAGERLAEPVPEGPEPRRKRIRSGSRSGSADGWAKGL